MLPKIQMPVFTIEDYSGKKRSFRPMLVREEKVLLMAKESGEHEDVLLAIKQVVNNCSLDKNLKIDSVPLFELELFFLKLVAFSVGSDIKASYRDLEDDKVYSFTIDLKRVGVRAEPTEKKIYVTPTAGVVMKYPDAGIYQSRESIKASQSSVIKLAARCIECVFDGDKVYTEFTQEELVEFIELVDIKSFQKVREFLENVPYLYHRIDYVNSMKNERTIELKTLSDFFTLL